MIKAEEQSLRVWDSALRLPSLRRGHWYLLYLPHRDVVRTGEAGVAGSTLNVWRGAQMWGVFTEVSPAYSFTVSILLTTKRENPLLSFMGGAFSWYKFVFGKYLLSVFSSILQPLSNCELPWTRCLGVCPSCRGEGRPSVNLKDVLMYLTLPSRNGGYFTPVLARVYFIEFNFSVNSSPSPSSHPELRFLSDKLF